MTNTNHGLVKTAPARELAFFGAHINLHYLFVLYAGVSIYIWLESALAIGRIFTF